jgi:glycosyltransferase involved in cell wall biosynthesis
MRVAIVCGHFMPEVGYQEVWIARTLARHGVKVRVVTSAAVSSSARRVVRQSYPAGHFQTAEGYELVRLPVAFRFRSAVLSRGVVEAVAEWQPDVILALGIGKLFVVPVLQARELEGISIVCFFSELAEYRRRHSFWARLFAWVQDRGFEIVKQRFYRVAFRRAALLVCNMPATLEWLRACCSTSEEEHLLREKARILTLGYDSSLFFFEPAERRMMRERLGYGEQDVVLITVTRVVPHKGLERVIEAIGELQRRGYPVAYVLVGALGDEYQRQLWQRMSRQPCPERFQLVPFLPAEETRRLAAAADLGVWMQPAISAQEAMGTGLPLVLPRRPSLCHLLQEGKSGWYWKEPEGFEEVLEFSVQKLLTLAEDERVRWRQQLALESRERFAYESILRKVFSELGFPWG